MTAYRDTEVGYTGRWKDFLKFLYESLAGGVARFHRVFSFRRHFSRQPRPQRCRCVMLLYVMWGARPRSCSHFRYVPLNRSNEIQCQAWLYASLPRLPDSPYLALTLCLLPIKNLSAHVMFQLVWVPLPSFLFCFYQSGKSTWNTLYSPIGRLPIFELSV